jgi:tetratricopeptide (TPR) repeat protein
MLACVGTADSADVVDRVSDGLYVLRSPQVHRRRYLRGVRCPCISPCSFLPATSVAAQADQRIVDFLAVPDQDPGARTQSWFAFQHQYAVRECILMLARRGPSIVVCESYDDLVCLDDDGTQRIISVKHREPGRGPWPLSELISRVVSPLARSWWRMGRRAVPRIVTNGALKEGRAGARPFAEACANGAWHRYGTTVVAEIERRGWHETTPFIDEFLNQLRIDDSLPSRAHLAHHDISAYMIPALQEIGVDIRLAARCYSFLENEVRLRMQGGTGVARSLLDTHGARDLVDATAAVRRWWTGRTLTLQTVRGVVSEVEAGAPIPVRPVLPPAPLCVNRDYEKQQLRRHFTGRPGAVLVTGEPGAGKSTICVEVAHEDKIAEIYGARRWLVRCDGVQTGDGLVVKIADSLGLPPQGDRRAAVMFALKAASGLLVLDNAETPWDSEPEGFEGVLAEMSQLGTITIVVSARGAHRGREMHWSARIRVKRLTRAAGREMFGALAGGEMLRRSRDIVDALEGHPGAVRLLASRARAIRSDEDLRRQWKLRQTSMLRESPLSPEVGEFGVAVDAVLATASAEARALCSVLGVLPDGLHYPDLLKLRGEAGDRDAGAVRDSELAYDDNERLRLLAPVREHIAARYPVSRKDRTLVVDHFIELSCDLGPRIGARGGAEATRRISGEMRNLQVTLRSGLRRRNPTQAIEAVLALTNLVRYTGVDGVSLVASARRRAAAVKATVLQGRAELALGRIAQARWELKRSETHFTKAKHIFHRIGHDRHEADSIFGLATVAQARQEYGGARIMLDDAAALYRRGDSEKGIADCIAKHGAIAVWQGEPEAERLLNNAISMYARLDDMLGQAGCLKELGDWELRRGHPERAEPRYASAMPLFAEADDVLGVANCHLRRAQAGLVDWESQPPAVREQSTARAKQLLPEAERLYMSIGSRLNVINCVSARADLARLEGSLPEAKRLYTQKLDLAAALGVPQQQGSALRRLAELAAGRGHLRQARDLFTRAASFAEHGPDLVVTGAAHRGLARLATHQNDEHRHVAVAREAYRRLGNDALVRELEIEFPGRTTGHDD